MRLSDYQWSGNPRGMHNKDVFDNSLDIELYRTTRMGWVKLVAAEMEYLNRIGDFIAMGATPVVRFYLPRPGATPLSQTARRILFNYANAGVRWFEYYNEPNLDIEWPNGTVPDWRNLGLIAPLMDNWLDFAEYVISLGAYPGFPPLAESDDPASAAVSWMDAMLYYLANTHYDRFVRVLANGAFCATHPYILNHFYQEMPGGGSFTARPPELQRAREGGWHFEYPYDPVSQRNDPGRTVYGGTALTPYGDPVGLTAMGRMFNERCATLFGTQAVPVLGTEGGIWDFPGPGEGSFQQDNRFPPYTNDSHAEATVAMFDWIAQFAPPWFFGVTLWKEDIYLQKGNKTLQRLREEAPLFKVVPPLEVMAGELPAAPVTPNPGPGPIHGQADYHMVVLDDTLSSDWFFETAYDYWNRFRPIVTERVDLFGNIPNAKSLAVTLIISEARLFEAETRIRTNYPNIFVDSIIITDATTQEEITALFNARTASGRRFG